MALTCQPTTCSNTCERETRRPGEGNREQLGAFVVAQNTVALTPTADPYAGPGAPRGGLHHRGGLSSRQGAAAKLPAQVAQS